MPKSTVVWIAAAATLASGFIWFLGNQDAVTSRTDIKPGIQSGLSASTLPTLDARPGTAPKPATSNHRRLIGTLSVLSAAIDRLGIVRGIDNETLDTGLAGAYDWSGPGETGVFALAAHRIGAGGPFRNLHNTAVGDQITVSTQDHAYIYNVTQVKVVSPNDVSVLNGSADKSEIVLITCTPIPSFSQRLVVTGELMRVNP